VLKLAETPWPAGGGYAAACLPPPKAYLRRHCRAAAAATGSYRLYAESGAAGLLQ